MAGIFDEPHQTGESAALPTPTPPSAPPMDALDRAVAEVAADVKHRPGVHGVGRGYGRPGRDAIVVYVEDRRYGEGLPEEVNGHPVIIDVVQGGFRAL